MIKRVVCEALGKLLCEFSYRWFDRFGIPLAAPLDDCNPKERNGLRPINKMINLIGDRTLRWGVYFYNC